MPVPSGKYGRSEYGALPVTAAYSLSCCCTLYLTHPGELVTPGKPSEAAAKWSSRLPRVPVRQWSTASGGGCVAGRARVDHGCVRARVVGKRKPHLPQPGAMADASSVRHDTIVVPETMSPAQVRALAERKAQAQVGDDDMVAFLHLHGSRPVGGEHGAEVEWRYSYQVIPSGGAAADTVG